MASRERKRTVVLYRQLEKITFTRKHYLSGMHALNIHDDCHHTGDWHSLAFWHDNAKLMKFGIMGDGEAYDTNPYLGILRIINATHRLRKMGKSVQKRRLPEAVMTLKELEKVLNEIGRKENKAVFTKNDLRHVFTDKSESWLSQVVSAAVKEGLLDRVKKGLYVHTKTSVLPFYVGTQLINAYRPNCINYISRESALSKWGVISQIPFCLTLMTTGRSGKILSDYGDYYFVHTARDVQKDLENKRIIQYDDRPFLAMPDVAVRDLKQVGLNVELIDWEAYEDAMEEAAAMPI